MIYKICLNRNHCCDEFIYLLMIYNLINVSFYLLSSRDELNLVSLLFSFIRLSTISLISINIFSDFCISCGLKMIYGTTGVDLNRNPRHH